MTWATSSLRQRVALVRCVLPLLLTLIVVVYETFEHVLYSPEPITFNFYAEVGFFGILGPALVVLTLTWITRSLVVQEQAAAEIHRLNATLEEQVAERTHSLERAYQELEQKNQELQTLDRLKSEFVSLVSHELRAPLTNINGGIELLLSRSDVNAPCRDTLLILSEEGRRLTRLVETILDVSVIEARRWPLNPGPVAVPPLVHTVIQQMQPCVGQHRIHWECKSDLPFAWADEDSLVQVLTNLLENAFKYSPEKSNIIIEAETHEEAVHIAVCDQGPGIPPEERDRVFDKFHRLNGRDDRQVYGHGLGLYVARRLVEAQRGRIWFESANGRGSRFVISLPRAPEGSAL